MIALDYVNRVGKVAEAEGHHPDILTLWSKVRISLVTHSINGLSDNDFIISDNNIASPKLQVGGDNNSGTAELGLYSGGWYFKIKNEGQNNHVKYISDNGKILPSRITSVSQKKQRELSLSIKRARNLALI